MSSILIDGTGKCLSGVKGFVVFQISTPLSKLTSPAAKIATTRPKSTLAPVMAILVPRLIVRFSSFSADMQAISQS